VDVLERHEQAGGRARTFKEGEFLFDMGPSWYWMPDVFERYFNCFGKKVSDYYQLQRLDPSYRVYWSESLMDIPADFGKLRELFEQTESGAAQALDRFMEEAAYKYRVGINKLVFKPGLSLGEFADAELLKGVFRLDVFNSIKKHVARHFKDPRLRQLLEFPVLFLGALPEQIPALYSLMNYADIKLGTWYPHKGMYSIVEGMHQLAVGLGVEYLFNADVKEITTSGNRATGVRFVGKDGASAELAADVVVAGADYHFVETRLLPPSLQSYDKDYWNKRVMAPSCLLYYVGLNKKLSGIQHHSLFFDVPFDRHGKEIYSNPQWPSNPLFYVSATSVSDQTVAPQGHENLFFLIPVAAGLQGDDEVLRENYFNRILERFEQRIGQRVREHIVCFKSYAVSDFQHDYNAFRGNAYGLANTLMQTAILKPSLRSRKVGNLFYTGQLTVPGPGVPPSLISGEVVARVIGKQFG
jgi:phytoene desaturase